LFQINPEKIVFFTGIEKDDHEDVVVSGNV
jgi:hypothetical protein